MLSKINRWILKLFGWKVIGSYPAEIKKKIIAVVPHTSNWDFPLGVMVRSVIKGYDIKFLGKQSLFKWPIGGFFKWMGGYPVDRSKSNNFVEQVVEIFQKEEDFTLVIAPEGTRKRVDKLRSGFYHMARLAQVPLILVKFDYKNKAVYFREPFYLSGDQEKDLGFIESYFRGTLGKVPAYSFI